MRKLLYILPVLLILGFAACENYVLSLRFVSYC